MVILSSGGREIREGSRDVGFSSDLKRSLGWALLSLATDNAWKEIARSNARVRRSISGLLDLNMNKYTAGVRGLVGFLVQLGLVFLTDLVM